ncbi:MAG: hypothetical protein QN132_11385 [Armatimonadota bacterium]|nr:hypothetical protein [Armatimonadota bacterium]
MIAGDDAGVAAAEEALEIAWRRAPGGDGLGRSVSEAAVEVGDELGQEGVGVFKRGDPAPAPLADEAILQGAPQALDAAFGLGGEPAGR